MDAQPNHRRRSDGTEQCERRWEFTLDEETETMMLSTLDREIRRAYDQLAPRYDYKFADYLRATHDVALRLAEPKEGEDILDASAGTGLLAERILPLVGNGRLVLLDLSSGMLQRSKQRIERYPQVACIA